MKTAVDQRIRVDWRLCFVADSAAAAGRDILALVARAAAGGATLIQLRGKAWPDGLFLERAAELKKLLRPGGLSLIINDRADIARAAAAAGVHLGQTDLPVAAARAVLGRRFLIGVSAGSPAEAMAGESAGADYIGAGPVFATRSKGDAGAPIGLEGIGRIREATGLPIVAIGGIDARNAAAAIAAGADGVAVISAITAAADPEGATARILEEVARGLIRRGAGPGRGGGRP